MFCLFCFFPQMLILWQFQVHLRVYLKLFWAKIWENWNVLLKRHQNDWYLFNHTSENYHYTIYWIITFQHTVYILHLDLLCNFAYAYLFSERLSDWYFLNEMKCLSFKVELKNIVLFHWIQHKHVKSKVSISKKGLCSL